MPRLCLFSLLLDARRLRALLRFRMGVRGLLRDAAYQRVVRQPQRMCDIRSIAAVGAVYHFVFVCPALAFVRS